MCQYSDEPEDSLQFSKDTPTAKELTKAIKKLVGETMDDIGIVGLAPFSAINPALEVSRRPFIFLCISCVLHFVVSNLPAYIFAA